MGYLGEEEVGFSALIAEGGKIFWLDLENNS